METLEALAASMTYAVQHNPNCPSPFLVRLPRGVIDYKPYAETRDFFGFGKSFDEAFENALRAHLLAQKDVE